jgi:TrmH family RNA methyltransferase
MSPSDTIVSSRQNPRVKQLRGAFAGHPRLSNGLTALEGEHLVEEAIRSGMLLKTVFLSERRPVPSFLPHSLEVLRLDDELFASLGDTCSPQGIAALMLPPVHTLDEVLWGVPLVLVACGLQDPGNLGTLIRSAEAFGASGVLTTPGTVSAWNGKALRASAGSAFRIPVVPCSIDDLSTLRRGGLRLLATVGEGVGTDLITEIDTVNLTAGTALLVGNEGSGLSVDLLALADARITIPCAGTVESLNAAVAGSILLYEAQRQRARVGVPA